MDENVKPELGPFEKKNITEYPLIQVNSNSDASDEELEQNPAEEVAPQEVSLSTFLVRSQLFGNQSGNELEFEKDGTPLLIKVKKKSDDSDDDEEVEPTPSTSAGGGNSGRSAAMGSGPGSSMTMESTSPTNNGSEHSDHSESSEEDNAQPSKEEANAAQEMVTYKLLKEISANPDTATALIQALTSIKFEIPMNNGTSRRCGVDFMNIEIPKNARIKQAKRVHQKWEKYPLKEGGSLEEGPYQETARTPTTNEPHRNPKTTAEKDERNQEVENVDHDVLVLDAGVDSVNFDEKEPENRELAGNGNNNNNGNKTPIKDRTTRNNKQTTKSPDHREVCFFPPPKSKNATIAAAEDHKRQVNVHGLHSEYMGPIASGAQDKQLYQLFRKLRREKVGAYGIDIKQYHIIGACPGRQSLGNDQEQIMRVTVDSTDTTSRIVNAATTGNLWGFKKKNEAFLRDIPPEKRSHTEDRKGSTKRKRSPSHEDKNATKRARSDRDPPKTKRRSSEPTKKGHWERELWHRPDEDISQTDKTPEEESERITRRELIKSIQEHQKLVKLDTRRCEKSGQESVQNKGSEVKTPKISPFRAVNEGNSDKKDEQSMGKISPLWKDSMPHLYNDSVQPGPSAQADRNNKHADDGGEEEEEEEVEVFYEKPEVEQIDREIHSELDSDDNEVDYSLALEYRREEMERKKRNEEHSMVQIKIEPQGDLGEEEEELFDYKEDQEADGESEVETVEESPKRRVLTRNMATVSRNRRRSARRKIERDQGTVPAR